MLEAINALTRQRARPTNSRLDGPQNAEGWRRKYAYAGLYAGAIADVEPSRDKTFSVLGYRRATHYDAPACCLGGTRDGRN